MKKFLMLLVPGLVLFSLIACSRSSERLAEINRVAEGIVWLKSDMKSFGCPSVKLEWDGLVLYFDTGKLEEPEGNLPPADIIFITHSDPDHFNVATLKRLSRPDTVIVTNKNCEKVLSGQWDPSKLMIVAPGESLVVRNIPVDIVPMYKSEENMKHPKHRGDTGFLLTLGDVRFYFSGSNGLTPDLKKLKGVDIACMNMQGRMQLNASSKEKHGAAGTVAYSLDGPEAIAAMKILKPAVFFPVYWLPNQRADIELAAAGAPRGTRFVMAPPWER